MPLWTEVTIYELQQLDQIKIHQAIHSSIIRAIKIKCQT